MNKKVNLHIYPSPFKNESRILKETKSVLDAGIVDEVIIVGTYGKGLKRKEIIDQQRCIHRIWTVFDSFPNHLIFQVPRFLCFQMVVFFKYLPKRLNFINCHSLSVLPVGVLLKALKKTKLIYDAHELETERAGLKGIKQRLAKLLEKFLFSYVDSTIVVSRSINRWYRTEYNTEKVYTVRNVPDLRLCPSLPNRKLLKEKFGIPTNQLLYIYQGLLSKGRGIDILLNVFADPTLSAHVVFMGYGNYEEKIKEFSRNHPNIHFQDAVPADQIISYTSSADIGICLIENIGLSYFYCLPNKVFEYTLAGIPVIVSDFPELASYVDSINGGWKIRPRESELKSLITSISFSEAERVTSGMKATESAIGWQFEEDELKNAFN